MSGSTRRGFLGSAGAVALVGVGPSPPPLEARSRTTAREGEAVAPAVNYWADGLMPSPAEHAKTLGSLAAADPDLKDRYGVGGAVGRLEERFAALTRKERALYLPSGTMANQLAIRVLSGDASKVLVQEQSHVFRDEADAAQVVHGKRLVPLAAGRGTFSAGELEEVVRGIRQGKAFATRLGALSIESPVRRAEGQVFEIDELRRVCALARAEGLGLHLDGARLFLACEYSGVGLEAYAALFDTVYISLYKYLGAPAGAVLCGSAAVIERVAHLRKVHGGDMYQSWPSAAVALRALETFPIRFAQARARADALFAALEATGRFEVRGLPHGSNVFRLGVRGANAGRFVERLKARWDVTLPAADPDGLIRIRVNETQLLRPNEQLLEAFEDAHVHAA